MLLAVENLDTGSLEIAMLLDEPPSRQYMPGSIGGQPWRRNGPLARAALTADLYGYAWLTIVYHKDDVRTWGQRRVKVSSGGRLHAATRSRLGVETGALRALRFETVAPDLFRPLHGRPTALPYKVVNDAQMALDPELETDYGDAHELLGFREQRAAGAPDAPSETGKFVRADLGCRVVWTDERRYGETWFLQDEAGFAAYRFELTEFQRRPFVADILARLGFVRPIELPSTAVTSERSRRQVRAHVQTICDSIQAVASIIAEHANSAHPVSTNQPQRQMSGAKSLPPADADGGVVEDDTNGAALAGATPAIGGVGDVGATQNLSSVAEAAEAAAAAAAAGLAASGLKDMYDDDGNEDKGTASESDVEDVAMQGEEFRFGPDSD